VAAGKIQGRRSGGRLRHPLDLPPGDWAVTLRTTWVEPAYVETDASWCVPGGEPATALANGGAFGGKMASPAPAAARELADRYSRAVRVVLSREDTVRMGSKRPPMAAGVNPDGTGVIRVARTPGIADAIHSAAPNVAVEEVDVPGPNTSTHIRAAGWAEAAVLLAAAANSTTVFSPNGANATATVDDHDGAINIRVDCGSALDETVLRSYCTGAAHMALGWVRSEGISVDDNGDPVDLTVRSFGILRARDTPRINVDIADSDREPINGSDAVFAAVATAAWQHAGCPQDWPINRGGRQ
jgi:CO/xanthine dehydrogenase Mo-binding subunit